MGGEEAVRRRRRGGGGEAAAARRRQGQDAVGTQWGGRAPLPHHKTEERTPFLILGHGALDPHPSLGMSALLWEQRQNVHRIRVDKLKQAAWGWYGNGTGVAWECYRADGGRRLVLMLVMVVAYGQVEMLRFSPSRRDSMDVERTAGCRTAQAPYA
jgi:hypothetical protein